jgi:hypothetical protein
MEDAARPETPVIVDLRDDSSVRYWCERWQVNEGELKKAVAKAGSAAPAVAFALGKEAY